MFWKKKTQIPWDQVGTQLGKKVVTDAIKLSQGIKKSFDGEQVNRKGLPDFESKKWLYELCLWEMFWVWYIAHAPKEMKLGATEPLLDTYHKSACVAMAEAGLLGARNFEQVQEMKINSQARFLVYKRAFDNPPPRLMIYTATLGWEFARFLCPNEEPNPGLVITMNSLGTDEFIGLCEIIDKLEKDYSC